MPNREEENFPRGGIVTKTKSQHTHVKKEKDLFQTNLESTERKKGRKRKTPGKEEKGQKKKRTPQKDADPFRPNPTYVHLLTYKNISEGVLTVGVVKEVQDLRLLVSLPHGLEGRVPITAISNTYTEMLKKLAQEDGEDSVGDDLGSLEDLFYVGQPVVCKVMEVTPLGTGGKKALRLSINPGDVSSHILASHLKTGMMVPGCISSVEDHGCVLDLGISNVNTFIKNQILQKYIASLCRDEPLKVGTVVPCLVSGAGKSSSEADENRVIKVTVDPAKVKECELSEESGVTIQGLVPGQAVQVTVHKVTEDGVTVKFLKYMGSIHKSHLMGKVTNYSHGQQFKAKVMCIEPATKSVALTQLSHILTPDPSTKLFHGLVKGQIIEEAEVRWVDGKRGVYFKLGDKVKGYASMKNLGDTPVQEAGDLFKVKSKHRCRIMNLNYADGVALVTLKESILSQPFLSYEDIEPGVIVKGKVKELIPKGMLVKVASGIEGFVPSIQLSDVPLKHPERKFIEGADVKCKVLVVDPSKKKLVMTCKKTLVTSKYPLVVDYNQCQHGVTLEGFIADIQEKGLVVVFYNNIKGWVPRNEWSVEKIEFPDKVFYVGQVVRCQVLQCKPAEQRLKLTLRLSGKTPLASKQVDLPDDFEIGKMVDCTVMGKRDSGLDVQVLPSGAAGFIPTAHLSDHMTNSQLLYDVVRAGDKLSDTMYWNAGNMIIATRKAILLQAAKRGNLITAFDQIKPGMLLSGNLKKTMDYGMFVEVGPGLLGLVPNKYLCDRKLPDPSQVLHPGQSVIAKVVEVDEEKQRFLLSLRMSDCYQGNTDVGLDLLESYFTERALIMEKLKKKKAVKAPFGDLQIGQVVKVEVTNVTEDGALCQLENGAKGFAIYEHTIGCNVSAGDECKAVVLYVDLKALCVELSLSPDLIAAITNFKDNKFSKAKEGQVVKSRVQLIKEDFVLVSLKGHTAGRLAYLPARRHLNDVLERHQYSVGQENAVVIKRVTEGRVLVSLQIHEATSTGDKTQKSPGRGKISLGNVVTASIREVHEFQANISAGGTLGRVHITEVTDRAAEGKNPLIDLEDGSEVKVKIIGFRETKSNRYLPVSRPGNTKVLLECSMKESKISQPDVEEAVNVQKQQFKPGDKVQAFVHNVSTSYIYTLVTPVVKGRIFLPHINPIPEDPSTHFVPGTVLNARVIGSSNSDMLDLAVSDDTTAVQQGSSAMGIINNVSESHGLTVQLAQGYKGRVALTDLADEYQDRPTREYKENEVIRCFVLECSDTDKGKCVLSRRKSRLGKKKKNTVTDPELESITDLKPGSTYRGYVVNATPHGLFIRLSHDIVGRVQYSQICDSFVKSPETIFYQGRLLKVHVLSTDAKNNKVELSLLKKHTGIKLDLPEASVTGKRHAAPEKVKVSKRKSTEEEDVSQKKKKKKKTDRHPTDSDSGVEMNKNSDSETEIQVMSKADIQSAPRLSLTSGFSWDNSFTMPSSGKEESDSELSGDEDEKPKSKKTRQEKLAEKKEEEKRLFQTEKELLSSDHVPETAEEFDRLVLQSPDSSLVWLRYMAFHLETTEIDKARAVAERALKTISFREEQEKMNVWVAYMNLENMYGTEESLDAVFKRAIQHNEPINVYNQLINIYVKSSKVEAAEQLYQTLVRRFSQNKDVWVNFGLFLFKSDKPESGRQVLQRALKSLSQRDHVETISKFGQMEFRHGEPERGKTIFENILSSYPKRTDLWSVYIDCVAKQGEVEATRQLYERVIHLNLSAKKMKFLFKKYMDFETKFGTEELVNTVKQKALDYVESKMESS